MEKVTVKLTDELKAKLQGTLGFDVKAEFVYVPHVFRDPKLSIPKELWPKFTLTSKDGIEIAEIEDSVGEVKYGNDNTRTVKFNSGSQRVQTLEAGIVRIENYLLENEKFLSFNKMTGELTIGETTSKCALVRDVIRYLPPALQVELQNAINERKTLTPEELSGLE
jgi:hypothetical protein